MTKTAMIVDDSRVARLLLKKLLLAADFDIIEFDSGEAALAHLVANDIEPDIIFMDVMMEGMDGLTATRKIKEDRRLRNIPVVMCTGNDSEEDLQRAKEAGAVTALSKPPEANALAASLEAINEQTSDTTLVEEKTEYDEAAIVARVLTSVEQHLSPNIRQQSHNAVEKISQDIVTEIAGKIVNEQLTKQLALISHTLQEELSSQLTEHVENSAQQACKKVAEESVIGLAVQAVQVVVDEAEIPAQVNQLLSQQGEEWLTDQEEELGTQLSSQLELHIPTMVAQHLDEALSPMVGGLVTELLAPVMQKNETVPTLNEQQIEEMIGVALDEQSTQLTAIYEEKNQLLTNQLSLNKKLTLGLALAVVGLLALVLL